MPPFDSGLGLLTSMITPAVLISACGTLILSTSNRLARIVDRVRKLGGILEGLFSSSHVDFETERRQELDRQLWFFARRGRLIQSALTCLYTALGLFVGTTLAIGAIALSPRLTWLPSALGILGALLLLYGCVLLIAEARWALRSVRSELDFALHLGELYRNRKVPSP